MLTRNAALSRTYLRLFLVFTAVYLVVYALSQWTQTSAGSTPTEPDRGVYIIANADAVTSRPTPP